MFLEAIKSGKTLRGFDIDSETRFEFYRVKGNEYVFQTFMEGYNTDFESRTTILNSDSEIEEFLFENVGSYPVFDEI